MITNGIWLRCAKEEKQLVQGPRTKVPKVPKVPNPQAHHLSDRLSVAKVRFLLRKPVMSQLLWLAGITNSFFFKPNFGHHFSFTRF